MDLEGASIHPPLWQLLHGKLKTHDELARCHILVHVGCDRCGGAVEDILHALRDCSCIKQAWSRLVPMDNHSTFFNSNLRDWAVDTYKISGRLHLPSLGIVSLASQFGGFWRNQFSVAGKLVDSLTVYLDIMARTNEIHRVNNSSISQQPRKKEILIRWLLPPWPWCKLNTDGSCKNA